MVARRAPGLKDVAAHAGVSISTVSRVINDGPYVTAAVRAQVLASMQALGYEPHALARSLRTGQSGTVGYVVADIANFLYATIARGIDDALQGHGYTMLLASSRGDAAHELAVIRELLRRRVDGLILSLSDETSPALRELLAHAGVPLVLLDREVAGLEADCVLVDHAGGVRAALAHLRGLGHRRVGLIVGGMTTRPGREIRRAFAQGAAELGLDDDVALVRAGVLSEAYGAQAMAELLDLRGRPSAVLAGGAQISVGALRTLRRRAVRLPEQLSLVAYDHTDVNELYSPAISVIARDIYAIGRQAAQLLARRAGGAAHPGEVAQIATELVVRGSTGPLLRG